MLNNEFFHRINLQLFAEGSGTGDGGAMGATEAAATSQTKGVNNPLADVKYGIQEDVQDAVAQVETPDRNAEFEKLIKGEFKDLYDAKVQDTVQKRLKGTKETVAKFEALSPTLELLARKYGLKDANDVDALNKAIEDDDAYFEEEALEKGVSVEQLKEIRKMEKENADLKRQMNERNAEENAAKIYSQWMEQANQASQIYPDLNLRAELQDAQFVNLLRNGVDVRTAYEVIHKDEIFPALMRHTAQTVEQKLTNKIIANGARPTENGNSSQSASLVKSDVSQLSKADREEIIRKVARGEKIRF